jgi:hypothetical protein
LVRCSPRMARPRYLLLGFLLASMVGGCAERTLEVQQRTFAAPDEAFWAYQNAARAINYAEVFSFLSSDQRGTAGELFWWLQRYADNRNEILRSLTPLESLSDGQRYEACFTLAGISPLYEESVAMEDLRRDAVRMKWDDSRRCYVFEYIFIPPNTWKEDPNVEVITEPDGRYAISLNYLWAGTDLAGIQIRGEMIRACRDAIREQDRLAHLRNGTRK